MNRYQLLHSTADLTVSRFDHPPHQVHHDPERETAVRWAVAFVQAGSFDVVVKGARRALNRGSVFATSPGLEFQCLHAEACPSDVCVSVAFTPTAVSAFEHVWERAGWTAREFATPRLAYVDRRMADAVASENQFEMERWALATLPALQSDADLAQPRGYYATRRDDIDAVVAVCEAIEANPTERRSIAERAREVGMPGTRLTYGFRRYAGVSPHQYVVRWRLAVAAELLSSGRSVSDTCYRAGFENLSHFCRTFQRTFGVRASTWHTVSLRERQRKVKALRGQHADDADTRR